MRFLAVSLLLMSAVPAHAAMGDVPEAIQGKWADRDQGCDSSNGSMVISATALVYPDGTIDNVVFTPEDKVIRVGE